MAWCARCAWGPARRLLRPSVTWRSIDQEAQRGLSCVDSVKLSQGPCTLEFKAFNEPQQPLQTCKQQISSYECPRKEEEVVGLDDGEAGHSRLVRHQAHSSLTPYMPSAEKQAAVNEDLLFTSPFMKLMKSCLRKGCTEQKCKDLELSSMEEVATETAAGSRGGEGLAGLARYVSRAPEGLVDPTATAPSQKSGGAGAGGGRGKGCRRASEPMESEDTTDEAMEGGDE
eukprot:1159124-Pelagomonas_calceolata.AAC.6